MQKNRKLLFKRKQLQYLLNKEIGWQIEENPVYVFKKPINQYNIYSSVPVVVVVAAAGALLPFLPLSTPLSSR